MNKNHLLLNEYKQNLETIIKSAKECGLNDEIIRKIFQKSLSKKIRKKSNFLIMLTIFASCFSIYVLLNVHTPTSSIVLRNVQGIMYPALKMVRTLFLPFIKLFPSLTNLYDESCLLQNPFFHLADMECWPCENVHSVLDVSGMEKKINIVEKVSEGIPFIIKSNLKSNHSEISLAAIQEALNIEPMESSSENFQFHYRINKMMNAVALRRLFPAPEFLPERSGQAVERFINIDSPTSDPYSLPNTECSYVFVMQGSGERTISLQPSPECRSKCKSLAILMKTSHVLLYNWWYWRPRSLPSRTKNKDLSITYINSYC
ncbi:unnamed protein product [Ceutorhynchus assimilis]|uniref:Uncharacterized protein n=1 Tax=Ceutorhynchus assimilis TaxID=467358 RepID=A0A9N9QIZ6_9CUCU|nr:unnamed protein product [Ceutorhynchus assimilis]